MKLQNLATYLIPGLIAGGFIGCGVGSLVGGTNALAVGGEIGSLVGLLGAGIFGITKRFE